MSEQKGLVFVNGTEGTLEFLVDQVAGFEGEQDIFVEISTSYKSVKTSTKKDSVKVAELNEVLKLELLGLENDIKIRVMDWDRFSSNDELATQTFAIADVTSTHSVEKAWIRLNNGVSVRLRIRFTPKE